MQNIRSKYAVVFSLRVKIEALISNKINGVNKSLRVAKIKFEQKMTVILLIMNILQHYFILILGKLSITIVLFFLKDLLQVVRFSLCKALQHPLNSLDFKNLTNLKSNELSG